MATVDEDQQSGFVLHTAGLQPARTGSDQRQDSRSYAVAICMSMPLRNLAIPIEGDCSGR